MRVKRASQERRRDDGYTLIEILVVLTIVVLVVSGATLGLASLTRANLRSSAVLISAGVRTGYTRAITQGHPVRLVLDMASNKVWLEETEDRLVLSRDPDDAAAGSSGGPDAEGQEAAAPPALAGAAFNIGASDFVIGATNTPRYQGARFQRIEGKRFDPRELPGGTRIVAVYTAHTQGRQEEGTQYLFFWPGGMTERAVVQVADADGTTFSVVVHPLTGKTRIEGVPVEPEADLADEEEQPEEAVDDER
jgi:general secretion pathway protein H